MTKRHQLAAVVAALLAGIAGCGGPTAEGKTDPAPEGAARFDETAVQPANNGGKAPAAPAGSGAAQGLPPGAVRLRQVEIMDRNGFAQPVAAATVLIPPDWRAEGGVVWNPQSVCGAGYTFNWSAASLDGSTGVAIFPGETWSANTFGAPSMDGCPTSGIDSARAYLEQVVQRSRPGARLLEYRARDDIAKEFSQLNQTTPTAMGEMRMWVEAGEVLIGYSENGRDMRETAAAVAIFSLSRMAGVYPGQTMDALSAQALPGFSMRAPNGALDFRLAEAIRASIKLTPQWEARISAHNLKTAQIQARGAAERSAIISRTSREISDMQSRSWEEGQASGDRRAREFSETIRGVETYDDPMSSAGSVQLSNQYENAWRLNDGSYVLTDDPSFNPYAATGQDGVRLEPQP